MKNFMMILCLLASPLTFAYGDDASDGSNTGGNKSSGGYGSGSGGSAAALIAVGAIIYFVRKNNAKQFQTSPADSIEIDSLNQNSKQQSSVD